MSEVWGDRSMGNEGMRITVVGVLAIAAVILLVPLLIFHLNESNQGPEQNHA